MLPSRRMEYDLFAFEQRSEPVSVRSVSRIHHDSETEVPTAERDEVIVSVDHSDGFGRLLQTRAQAEDVLFGDAAFGGGVISGDQNEPVTATSGRVRQPADPDNVVVSGWQTYDNKGRVVEKYEPFFAGGFAFAAPVDAELGQKATTLYDPRGHPVRTVNPDGSEQLTIIGVPTDLGDPDVLRAEPLGGVHVRRQRQRRTHPRRRHRALPQPLGHAVEHDGRRPRPHRCQHGPQRRRSGRLVHDRVRRRHPRQRDDGHRSVGPRRVPLPARPAWPPVASRQHRRRTCRTPCSTPSAARSSAATAKGRSRSPPSTPCSGRRGCGPATTPPVRSPCASASSTGTAAAPTSRRASGSRRGRTTCSVTSSPTSTRPVSSRSPTSTSRATSSTLLVG